jgi:hypothetical protein
MVRQTITFFRCGHNLFRDSNYVSPHYALFPNPAYVLSVKSTYSPEHPHFVFHEYAFSERRVSTRDPGVTLCRTRNSLSAFYSIGCYNYLPYIVTIAMAHMYRFLIAVSVIVTKRLDGSEKCPFAPTTNHLYIALKTGSVRLVLQKTVSETVSANVKRREWVLYPPTSLQPFPYATLLCNQ